MEFGNGDDDRDRPIHPGTTKNPPDPRYRRDEMSFDRRKKHRGYDNIDRNFDFGSKQPNYYQNDDDWKCLECATWNDGSYRECKRCRSYPHSSGSKLQDWARCTRDYHNSVEGPKSRGTSCADEEESATVTPGPLNSNEFDEFGRIKSSFPKKTRWPPCFETNGSAFVLDARSGMFYESVSDFFFDPKSKLYYGNKQGAYFKYDSTKHSFDLVSNISADRSLNSSNARVIEESSCATTKKASILINLKTKELKSGSAAVTKKTKKDSTNLKEKVLTPEVEVTVVVPKQHAADMEKWSERQNETRFDSIETKKDESSKTIPTTVKGEPICLLCRRRFPNIDKLRYHEEASTLHKENLAKQGTSTKTTDIFPVEVKTSELSANYVDRAKQRRKMHQTEAETFRLSNMDRPTTDFGEAVPKDSLNSMDSVHRKCNLDETNIGHQMLQKLGWKSGNGLGRVVDNSQCDANVTGSVNTTSSVSQPVSTPATTLIQQDWDRIEFMATSATPQRGIQTMKKGIGSLK